MADKRRQRPMGRRAKKALSPPPAGQKHTSQSLREATEKLIEVSKGQDGSQRSEKVYGIVYTLKSQRLRSATNAHAFWSFGGVGALLRLLERREECEDKTVALILGTLGNLCALDAATRTEVIQADTAPADIVGVLKNCTSSACLNTAARVVGNLALDDASVGILRELGVVRELNHVLSSVATDSGCRQSALRSLRILCGDSECREELKTTDGLLAISACLKSANEGVVLAALQVVAVLTQDCDSDAIQSLCTHGTMPQIVQLSHHSKVKVQRESINVILCCCKNSDGRVALGSAGGIETLVQFLEQCQPSNQIFMEVTSALCICCRDVISRQRLRDCGGLEFLIDMLAKAEFTSMHSSILSALICYYFDENTLKFMVKRLRLLKALTYQLREMTRKAQTDHLDSPELTEGGEEESVGGRTVGEHTASPEQIVDGRTVGEREGQLPERGEEGHGTDTGSECCVELLEGSVPATGQHDHGVSASPAVSAAAEQEATCEHRPCSSPGAAESKILCEGSEAGISIGQDEPDSLSSVPDCASPAGLSAQLEESPAEAEVIKTVSSSVSVGTSSVVGGLEEVIPDVQAVADSSILTPPPAKRSKLQLDFETSTPMPANFIDSLLSSPTPYQSPQTFCEFSPLPTELATTLETQVVLLLSRVSHLRDCLTCLASQDVLQDVLSYYYSQEGPNVHVFKVMTRVFMNPHCFQDCLMSLVPSTIYGHLTLPDGLDHQRYGLSLTVSASPSSVLGNRPATASPVSCYSPIHFSAVVTPDARETATSSEHMFYSTSWELLERLSKVAESPYGQGVLAHMLLRGDDREKRASCLAIPLLCRSVRLCHKLMVGYRGLELLTSLVTMDTEESLQVLAIDSFLRLATNMENSGVKRKRSISDDITGYLPPSKFPRTDSWEGAPTDDSPSDSANPSSDVSRATERLSTCYYRDSDHHPFDLTLRVSNVHTCANPVDIPVHRHILCDSSDLFSVMLGGQYRESGESEVAIRHVPPAALKSVVHHLYGCGWLCSSVLEEVLQTEGEEEEEEEEEEEKVGVKGDSAAWAATEAIVQEASSVFDFHEDQGLSRHSLEVVAVSTRFLLPDLTARSEQFAASLITPSNVVSIFHFAQLHQSCCLAQQCVQRVVSMAHSRLQRQVFRNLISSSEGEEALRLFQTFITTRLT